MLKLLYKFVYCDQNYLLNHQYQYCLYEEIFENLNHAKEMLNINL